MLHAASDDSIFSKTEDEVYATLRAAGYTRAGACGIMGNMSVENPRFEPDLEANRGVTYGLFQWNDVGDRRSNLEKWCKNRQLDHRRVDGQLGYAMYEIEGGDPIAYRVEKFLKSTENPKDAAMEFAVGFERCVGSTPTPENDGRYDGSIFPEYYGKTYQALNLRKNNAQRYYNGYAGVGESDFAEKAIEIKIKPTAGVVAEKESDIQIKIQHSLDIFVNEVHQEDPLRMWTARAICLAIGYVCGCMIISVLIVRRKKVAIDYFKDPNHMPHMTNILSHIGIPEAIFAFICDIARVYLAVLIAGFVTKGILVDEGILWTGLGVILGNEYPVWNKFRGSHGFTVTVMLLLLYMPIWGLVCGVIGILMAVICKSLPIGIMFMGVSMIPFAFLCKNWVGGLFVTIFIVLLIASHAKFIRRYVHHHHWGRGRLSTKCNT